MPSFSFQVKLGPTFIFVVQGTAVEPCLEFSFTKFNFGKCFLYCPGMVPTCQTLVMSNRGAKGIRCWLFMLLDTGTKKGQMCTNKYLFYFQ